MILPVSSISFSELVILFANKKIKHDIHLQNILQLKMLLFSVSIKAIFTYKNSLKSLIRVAKMDF